MLINLLRLFLRERVYINRTEGNPVTRIDPGGLGSFKLN